MTPLELALYGLVQGATEFLPVSSSAHLYALEHLFAWPEAGRTLAVASHAGSLVALLVAFRSEVIGLGHGALLLARGQTSGPEAQEVIRIAIASLPIFAVGVVVAVLVAEAWLSLLPIMAASTAAGAVLLWAADQGWIRLAWARAGGSAAYWFIGAMQVLALIPGASRAGCVITAARIAGFDRTAAARFAFLLGLPAVGGATAVEAWRLLQAPDPVLGAAAAAVMAVAGLSALGAIHLLLRWIRYRSFTPFVLYRLALAGLLGWLAVLA